MGWKYTSSAKATKAALLKASACATRDTARAIARSAATRAVRDTGALAASLYVSDATPGNTGGSQSGYGAAVSAATSANSRAGIEPEVPQSAAPDGVMKCAVASAVDYAEEIEKGGYSAGGYRAPKPFLEPAAAEERPGFESRLDGALRAVEARQKL